jgi:hypothetical protein
LLFDTDYAASDQGNTKKDRERLKEKHQSRK